MQSHNALNHRSQINNQHLVIRHLLQSIIKLHMSHIRQKIKNILQPINNIIVHRQSPLGHILQISGDLPQLPAETLQALDLVGDFLAEGALGVAVDVAEEVFDSDFLGLFGADFGGQVGEGFG